MLIDSDQVQQESALLGTALLSLPARVMSWDPSTAFFVAFIAGFGWLMGVWVYELALTANSKMTQVFDIANNWTVLQAIGIYVAVWALCWAIHFSRQAGERQGLVDEYATKYGERHD